MEAVRYFPGFFSAFQALGHFMGYVLGKVGNMREMKVGTTKAAVRVFRNYLLCGAQKWKFSGFPALLLIILGVVLHWPGFGIFHLSSFSRTSMWLWPLSSQILSAQKEGF